jgi:hypothetical protein
MDSTHIRWLEESLEKNTVHKILKAENGIIGKDKESMTVMRKDEPKRAPVVPNRRGP